jgi:hypothetical protein
VAAAQGKHPAAAAELAAISAVRYLPAAHFVQSTAASMAAVSPAPHGLQLVLPFWSWCLPGAHLSHKAHGGVHVGLSLNLPGAQSLHAASKLTPPRLLPV